MSVIRFKAPKTCHVMSNGALVMYADYRELENERNALAAQVEELKAQIIDAVGDGFYDGYLQCVNDAKNNHFDSYVINDNDVLRLSEQHESEHPYSKSIADIRAKHSEELALVLIEASDNAGANGYLEEAQAMADAAELIKAHQANHDAMINNLIESTGGEI